MPKYIPTPAHDDPEPPRRGLLDRPVKPANLEEALGVRFGLTATRPLEDIGGSSTLNLRMQTAARAYVVRIYRDWVTPARLEAIQAARCHLATAGIPCLPPIPANNGSTVQEHTARIVPDTDATP